ncbi:hypothetical protein EYF80_022511 [Liparis tanakae]|uniref:Uncharacterized protein n=1 Tax=Liparis tanakae TaxID=230148 RepID=A0A4Z2HR55_9TELE|nr:hypothetical protein EYF80_022511 [Liparis tanakae]
MLLFSEEEGLGTNESLDLDFGRVGGNLVGDSWRIEAGLWVHLVKLKGTTGNRKSRPIEDEGGDRDGLIESSGDMNSTCTSLRVTGPTS